MEKEKIYGLIMGFCGVLLFSAKAVLVKLAYNYNVLALDLLLLRMVFSLPFFLIIAFTVKRTDKVQIKVKDYLWILILGVTGYYLASYFDFIGLQYLKASLERVILFCYPTIVVVLSFIIFKEKPDIRTVFAILIAYLGILIIFWEELELSGANSLLGGILVFSSAVTYAIYLVGSGRMIPLFGVKAFTSYAMVVACVCVILHYLIANTITIFNYKNEVYILGLIIAFFCTVLPTYLVSGAIKRMGASKFSVLSGFGPVSTIILAGILLDEQITILQLLGIFVVTFGILMISVKQKAKTRGS